MKLVFAFALMILMFALTANAQELLNVSYDPTREFYRDYNKIFADYWRQKTGENIEIKQSHGGSGKQARAVIEGLRADVVTLALAYDIDIIAEKSGLLPQDWQSKLPNNSAPYNSTIVFLVRKGNPKNIKDWDDLARENISVITANPKTSGGARWNYLAAWGYAENHFSGDQNKINDFIKRLYKNVPVLDSAARGSTITFTERGIGDVLIAWENEAYLALKDNGTNKFQIIYPSISIKTEPTVAVVEKNAEENGNSKAAIEYLKYLYSKPAQELAAKSYFRPSDRDILFKYSSRFPQLKLLTIADFGGWQAAQRQHFVDGGTFDKIYSGD